MEIINSLLLQNFWQINPVAEDGLKAWFYEIKAQTWQERRDVLKFFSQAKLIEEGGTVFEIIPNQCYLESVYKPSLQILFIKKLTRTQTTVL